MNLSPHLACIRQVVSTLRRPPAHAIEPDNVSTDDQAVGCGQVAPERGAGSTSGDYLVRRLPALILGSENRSFPSPSTPW